MVRPNHHKATQVTKRTNGKSRRSALPEVEEESTFMSSDTKS